MSTAVAPMFGVLILAFCWWHVPRGLRGGLRCISDTKHCTLIDVALTTLLLSWLHVIFSRWASLNQHGVGYEHYLHHALTEYMNNGVVGLWV